MGLSANDKNDMEWRVSRVKELLLKMNYNFNNKKLLEEALTHSSSLATKTPSYQRLEFIGDAVLAMVISDFVFHKFPELNEGQLSLLKEVNTTNAKLARVAIRHDLYTCLRTTGTADLDRKVKEFELAIQQEEEEEVKTMVYGGAIEAPKVLADIVESIIGAIYLDSGSNLKVLWQVLEDLLQPIVTVDTMPSQPVTKVFEFCHQTRKRVHFKVWRDADSMSNCWIYVDGEPFAFGLSDQNKDVAKRNAAKEALMKFDISDINNIMDTSCMINELNPNQVPTQWLHTLCAKKKWVKPSYSKEEERGPDHDKKFTYRVCIETENGALTTTGAEKSSVKEAERSAASSMINQLKELYPSNT